MDKALGDYERLGREIGRLVNEKKKAYGNSFGKAGEFLKLLFPDGIEPDKYIDALALVRIFDKQMRIATHKDALGENPYQDIAGYGLLGAMLVPVNNSGPLPAVSDKAKPSVLMDMVDEHF
jgi:hypothetical protein